MKPAIGYALGSGESTIGVRISFFMASAAPFAAAVVRLYSEKELWLTLAHNSYRHVEENFTPEVIAATINNSIKEVACR